MSHPTLWYRTTVLVFKPGENGHKYISGNAIISGCDGGAPAALGGACRAQPYKALADPDCFFTTALKVQAPYHICASRH